MTTSPPWHGAGNKVGLDAMSSHPERIDVRSPSEYALDHLPGAINLPVLDDDERRVVGTLHAQESAFAARRLLPIILKSSENQWKIQRQIQSVTLTR